MSSAFLSSFFKGNRRRLRAAVGKDQLIVITAHGIVQRTGSVSYPFRQDSNFWYLTGIDEPGVILVMHGVQEFLIVPMREGIYATFEGNADIQALSKTSGIADIQFDWTELTTLVSATKSIATCEANSAYNADVLTYTNPARAHLIDRLRAIRPDFELRDIRRDLAYLRMIKQAPELTTIRRAVDISVQAFLHLNEAMPSFKTERDITTAVDAIFGPNRAVVAYETIAAAGVNACTLHYVGGDDALKPGQLVLIDAGAEFQNYCSDISRTYSTTKATKRQSQVLEAVADVQAYAKTQLKPGISVRDYESLIEVYMGKQLHKLGLIKDQTRDNIRHYYPHAASHYLGLDAHDAGDYQVPLEPGMVLTVEPGIYIPEEQFGVRIEDDVVLTDQGLEVLSQALPTI